MGEQLRRGVPFLEDSERWEAWGSFEWGEGSLRKSSNNAEAEHVEHRMAD